MARKFPGGQRALGEETVVAIVYGEISSSLYFALGIVALWALGLTPLVLIFAGLVFALAAGAFAEGAMLVDSAGGSSAIARRAFGDTVGFLVGWAVLLDLAVVISLSLLSVPQYGAAAIGKPDLFTGRADEAIAIGLAVLLGLVRLVRRTPIYRIALVVAAADAAVQLLLVVLGLALVFERSLVTRHLDVGTVPTWNAIGYALPIAFIAYAGIEIVANLVRERRNPGTSMARGTIAAVGATMVVYVLVATVALSAFPVTRDPAAPSGYASALSTTWIGAPLAGVAEQIGNQISPAAGSALRALVGVSAMLVLVAAAVTAFSGATRVLGALGEQNALPELLVRRSRRALTAPGAIWLVVGMVAVLLPVASALGREGTALASIYSFGILISYMAVFLSVLRLRFTEPDTMRPTKLRGNVRFGDVDMPVSALAGFALTWMVWLLALGTHRAARIVPPLWLLAGFVLFVLVRRARGLGLRDRFMPVSAPPPDLIEIPYGAILVPVKQAGPIEEEMLATACKLAAQQGARVIALKVIEVPLDLELDAPLPEEDAAAERAMELARGFGPDYGIEVEARVVRARAISSTVVLEARTAGAGLILIGAVPHVSRQAGRAHVFSETVENLLRRADTRVILTAFPTGTALTEEQQASADTVGA